jgi:ATP-dependent Clp protease ATP-binding subunit ClpC
LIIQSDQPFINLLLIHLFSLSVNLIAGDRFMETLNAQELYNKAFLHYKQKEYTAASECIEKALALAPEDLAVHALAMHIKIRNSFESDDDDYSYLSHAEFIMEHDIHYRDTASKDCDPSAFIDEAMDAYYFMRSNYKRLIRHSEDGNKYDKECKDLNNRHCKYAFKALQAGYPIPHIDSLAEALVSLERTEDLLKVASVLFKITDAKDAGLPGIEKIDRNLDDLSNIIDEVAKVLYKTSRFEEAIKFFTSVIGKESDLNHTIHNYLGEFYCLVDQPEETARQWIISVDKAGWFEDQFDFKGLCMIVADPEAGKKIALAARLNEVMDKVSEERKPVANSVLTQIRLSIGDPDTKIMDDVVVESKIGMKLPPETEKHYCRLGKLWLPGTMGDRPFGPAVRKKQAEKKENESSAKISAQVMPQRPHTIEKYGVDVTDLARLGKLPPITGRDKEIDSLVRILLRMEKNNPVLLGPAGVGKTAIIQGLAQRIVSENVPAFLKNRRVIELSMSALVAGTTFRGDFEKRITGIIDEARDNPDIILFIDELHTIMGAGAAQRGDLDAANIVKPALAKGTLRLVGATTTQEYSKCIEADPAMARRFTPVRVGELGRNATMEVLARRRDRWREYHKVEISEDVLKAAIELTDLHVKNRMFPDKAIDLLDESCAYARTRCSPDVDGFWRLNSNDIREVMMEWTGGVYEEKFEKTNQEALNIPSYSDMLLRFRDKLFGQEKAIEVLSRVVVQHRLSLKDLDVPVSLLFYGPKGSGKTEAAEVLAGILWPDEKDRLMQLNLYEYGDSHGLFRLIGPPPGYSGGGGILSARLKRQPRSIIVLRNFTAGHSQVRRFFAQLLRHGVYMDSSGRKISASDAVIIVLVDSAVRSKQMGFGGSGDGRIESAQKIIKSFEQGGEPDEFNGAFTYTVAFNELSDKTVKKIFEKRINSIRGDYAGKGFTVNFNSKFVKDLVGQFLKQPPEKRDIGSFIEKAVISRVREAAFEKLSGA